MTINNCQEKFASKGKVSNMWCVKLIMHGLLDNGTVTQNCDNLGCWVVVKRGTLLNKSVPLHSLPWYVLRMWSAHRMAWLCVGSVWSHADMVFGGGSPVPDRGMKVGCAPCEFG